MVYYGMPRIRESASVSELLENARQSGQRMIQSDDLHGWQAPFTEQEIALFEKHANAGSFSHITHLDLMQAFDQEESACRILSVLHQLPNLRYLDLSLCPVGPKAIGVFDALAAKGQLGSLENFLLRGSGIDADTAGSLGTVIASLPTLQALNLGYNDRLGPRGITALATELDASRNFKLEYLNLKQCNVGPAGMAALADAGRLLWPLRGIDLAGNHIGNMGLANFARGASELSRLEGLNLDQNEIDDESVTDILTCLHTCKSIKSLSIARNQISDQGAIRIAQALGDISHLTRLNLNWNPIGDKTVDAFATAVRSSALRDFEHLFIESTRISQESMRELRQAASKRVCPHLKVFNSIVERVAADSSGSDGQSDSDWQRVLLDKMRGAVTESESKKDSAARVPNNLTDPSAKLRLLSDRIMPKISPEDISELESILREAQIHTPSDTKEFTDSVNALLDAFSLRLQTAEGDLGRLRASKGSVEITRAAGGTRGFKNATVSLVAVDRIRVGNRYTISSEVPKDR